ncbi:MAG: ABC transporter substrate-binding protein [bacterium]|nr:ABC transporter substrate-binding protein [bacterium]
MKHNSIFIACFIFVSLLAANFTEHAAGEASKPLIIGIPHSEAYPYAAMMKNSFEMALKEINREGGIKGQPLKLVYADDQGKKEPGEKAVKDLIKKKGALMLVGAYQSSNTVYMAGLANKLDRPFLVCTAADDRITQRKWKNVYRLNAPAGEYTKGLEEFFLKKIKPKSMVLIYENSPYGTGGALRMMWFCREHDIEILAGIPYHKERAKKEAIGSAYFQRLLTSLKEEPPDVIYMVSYLNDAALLVKKIQQLNIKSLLSGGAGGFTHQKFLNKAGKAANHLLTATLWTHQLSYPGTRDYYNRYLNKYSIAPDYHGAEAYSALLVAADALKRADSFRPESIRAALDQTDMMTPFGPVKFSSYSRFERQNSLPTQVLQIIDGKFECVWPEKLATSKFVPPSNWRSSE